MPNRIASTPFNRIPVFLENQDLLTLGSTSRLMRHIAIENLIDRELTSYPQSNLTELEKRLFIVAKIGISEWVEKYIRQGVNVNCVLELDADNEITPIYYAALSGVLKCVTLLKEHGAVYLPAEPQLYFTSPLHFAAAGGDPDCVTYFLDLGVPVDQFCSANCIFGQNSTPLQIAAAAGKQLNVILLIASDASVTYADLDGNQAIHHAAMSGNGKTVSALIAGGADANVENGEGTTPLLLACARLDAQAASTVQELLQGRARPRDTTYNDKLLLPLQCCILKRNLLTAAALLAFDSTLIDARYEIEGKVVPVLYGDHTALHIAASINYQEGVIFLLDHHADIRIKTAIDNNAADLVKDPQSPIVKILAGYRNIRDLVKTIKRTQRNILLAALPPMPVIHEDTSQNVITVHFDPEEVRPPPPVMDEAIIMFPETSSWCRPC